MILIDPYFLMRNVYLSHQKFDDEKKNFVREERSEIILEIELDWMMKRDIHGYFVDRTII